MTLAPVGYNLTLGWSAPEAQKVARPARKRKVRRVIVDVRLDPGGDNHTYAPLLRALRAKTVNRRGRLVVLTRAAPSPPRRTSSPSSSGRRAVIVGETSGGSLNLWGDVRPADLPSAGVRVNIASVYWQKSFAADIRVAIGPKVSVPVSSKAFFRGRGPGARGRAGLSRRSLDSAP